MFADPEELERGAPLEGDEQEEEEEEEEEEDALQDEFMGHDLLQEESESASESGTESLTWISWFCSLPGHEYFAEVSEDFIEDDFNLTGLNALVPFYKEALEMILDVEPQDSPKIPDVSIVESSAELLYGLIHQRYILTRQGLQQMVEKFESGHFGYCPRVYCHSHPVLPCGRSDLPGLDTVKLFCANCVDNYAPPSSRFHGVDGAFFGTTFPHLLFQCYRDLAPAPIAAPNPTENPVEPTAEQVEAGKTQQVNIAFRANEAELGRNGGFPDGHGEKSTLPPSLLGQKIPNAKLYTPRIYGFRVSEHAKSGPRMRWMRTRPESWDELMERLPPGEGYRRKLQRLTEQSQGAISEEAAPGSTAEAEAGKTAAGDVDEILEDIKQGSAESAKASSSLIGSNGLSTSTATPAGGTGAAKSSTSQSAAADGSSAIEVEGAEAADTTATGAAKPAAAAATRAAEAAGGAGSDAMAIASDAGPPESVDMAVETRSEGMAVSETGR